MVVRIIVVISLLLSVAWYIKQPGFEPLLAVLGSLAALVPFFMIRKRGKAQQNAIHQTQTVSHSSTGIQVGGNLSINERKDNDDAE